MIIYPNHNAHVAEYFSVNNMVRCALHEAVLGLQYKVLNKAKTEPVQLCFDF